MEIFILSYIRHIPTSVLEVSIFIGHKFRHIHHISSSIVLVNLLIQMFLSDPPYVDLAGY